MKPYHIVWAMSIALATGLMLGGVVATLFPAHTSEDNGLPSGVSKFVDKDSNVVCWTLNGYGISCLPMSSANMYR
jgi:hypothetical protein